MFFEEVALTLMNGGVILGAKYHCERKCKNRYRPVFVKSTLSDSKMTQLWNGIARNYMDRFWWYLAKIRPC